jgi:hypothetical protein
MKITMMRMGMPQSTPGDWGESKLPPKDLKTMKYVTLEEEDKFMLIGGPVEKLQFFQIAPGPILSSPIHSNSSQYDPCKV